MSGTSIFVALPCFGGLITAQCANAVIRLTHALRDMEVPYTVEYELHESLVQRARNSLTHRFLKSNSTHLLFIDADIEFVARDVIGLLAAGKPLVCGAYPRKAIKWDQVLDAAQRGEKDPSASAASFVVNVLPPKDGEVETTMQADEGCVPVLDAATGFMLVAREVFEQMAVAMPEIAYVSDETHPSRGRGEIIHAFFDCAIVDGRYLSEDYLFSRRWQRLGGTVWLFLLANLGHVGSYTFRGDLSKTFRPVVA